MQLTMYILMVLTGFSWATSKRCTYLLFTTFKSVTHSLEYVKAILE